VFMGPSDELNVKPPRVPLFFTLVSLD